MKIVIMAGVVSLCILVMFVGMLLPDDVENATLSWVASSVESAKQARILESSEYQALRTENEGLKTQLNLYEASCSVESSEGALASVLGWWPF